jgi:hypothetical protein
MPNLSLKTLLAVGEAPFDTIPSSPVAQLGDGGAVRGGVRARHDADAPDSAAVPAQQRRER